MLPSMQMFSRLLTMAALLVMPAGASMAQSAAGDREAAATQALIGDGERLLFVGNSYMANEGGVFNYLAKALATADKSRIHTDKHIYYGKPLSAMLTDDVKSAIASVRFDSVVITSGRLETMREFQRLIEASGKKTIVFVTWDGRHPGNRATKESYTESTKRAVAAVRQFERETKATVVPIAVAYHDLILNPPAGVSRVDYLWRPGNIHQNKLGTMVNAWMLYAVLTGKSPVGVDFDMPPHVVGEKLSDDPQIRLTAELRHALQSRVWKVAQAWQAGKSHLE